MTAAEFESAVVVGIAELANAVGIERRRLKRQLERDGVRLSWTGKRWVVFRAALRRQMPDFYDGVVERLAEQAA